MIGNNVGSVISSDAFMNVIDERLTELLNISDDKVSKLRKLPAEISALLQS